MSNDKLAEALREAAASLRTLERSAMREEYLDDPYSVRAYARSRAEVAENALQAHAAEAAQAQAQSGEWVMVPKEPTKAMIEASCKIKLGRLEALRDGHGASSGVASAVREEWDAMLAAAQQQAAEPVYQVKFPGDEGWCDTSIEDYTSMDHCTRRVLYTNPQPAQDASKYQELLMAVEKKFPGESRHETALRYIRQAELRSCEPKCDSSMAKESGR